MNEFLKNFMPFMRDLKRRNFIIVSTGIVLLMITIGFVQLIKPKRTKKFQGRAHIESVNSIRSIPGGLDKAPSKEYIQLQRAHNQQKARQASETGQSFIATIVDGAKVAVPNHDTHFEDINKHFNIEPITASSQRKATEVEAVLARQNELLSEQKTEMLEQQLQGAMSQQINQLMGVWSHRLAAQETIEGLDNKVNTAQKLDQTVSDLAKYIKEPIKAGSILRGILLTSVNSDAPGPILAKVTTDHLKGAQLIGTLSNLGERVLIKFHQMNIPDYPKSIPINAVAVDASKADIGIASYTDRHLMLRYGSLFGAALIEGYSLALQRSGKVPIEYYDLNVPAEKLKSDHVGKFSGALGQVGSQVSAALAKDFHKPATVYVYAGTGIGILFMEDLGSAAGQTENDHG